jgi:hypothetical protein
MPDETSARLWDLRAQGEALLRRLNIAQQCLEAAKEGRHDALINLRNELRAIDDAVRLIGQTVADASEHVDAIHAAQRLATSQPTE